jgi:catecholate siderophore receptor
MLATTAAAQEPGTSPQVTATPAQQQTTAPSQSVTLPQINVRSSRRRTARPQPAQAPTASPAPAIAPPTPEPSYQAGEQTITRLPTPLRDTPQTVNVVPQQSIRDQGLRSVEDALRTVPGITFQAGEGGQQGDSPVIRGFVARGDVFRDGIRDPGWYTRDLFNADRVEVYKGPSAFAFGRGSTGGAINIVSKLPTGRTFAEGTVTGTTDAGYRVELDAGGRKDNVSGRIAALAQDVPTPDRNHVWTKRYGVAPSVTVDFTPTTKVTLRYIYQSEESIPDYGWPYLPMPVYSSVTGALSNPGYNGDGSPTTPVPIPRQNWFGIVGGPLKDLVQTDTHIATAKFEHDLAPDIKLVNATRYISNDRSARPTAPRVLGQAGSTAAPPPGYPVHLMTIGRQHFWNETNNTLLVNQTDLVGKFSTGSFLHTFAVGLELARETRHQRRARGMTPTNLCDPNNALCRTSLYFPIDTSFGGAFAGWNAPLETEMNNFAVYALDQIRINEFFELLGSIRHDSLDTTFEDPGNATPANRHLSRKDDMTSWRIGGVFHPFSKVSLYGAYGVSFNPASELGTLSGSPTSQASVTLDPEQNTTIEFGAKADVLGGRLSLASAVFRIEKTNLRILNDPSLPAAEQFLVLDGLARVQGFEATVAGHLTSRWQVIGGYSYLDSQILNTRNLAELGNELPATPHHNFTLWSTYDVMPKVTIGGGAFYQSAAFVNVTNTAYVPAYWRFDAMASYRVTKNSTLQLNIYNITDEMYFAQYYQGHAVPASGRYASLSYRVRWAPETFKPLPPIITK